MPDDLRLSLGGVGKFLAISKDEKETTEKKWQSCSSRPKKAPNNFLYTLCFQTLRALEIKCQVEKG